MAKPAFSILHDNPTEVTVFLGPAGLGACVAPASPALGQGCGGRLSSREEGSPPGRAAAAPPPGGQRLREGLGSSGYPSRCLHSYAKEHCSAFDWCWKGALVVGSPVGMAGDGHPAGTGRAGWGWDGEP